MMKLALVQTLIYLFLTSAFQTDNYKTALKLNTGKQFEASNRLCTSELEKLDIKDNRYTEFLALRADNYRELKDFEAGISDYQKLIRIHPNGTRYYLGLGYLYGESKEYSKCLAVLRDAININHKDVYVLNNLSYYSNQAGNFKAGISYADQGLSHVSEPIWKAALLNNRGYGNLYLNNYNLALKDINEAIKLDPNNSFAYAYRAIANVMLKNFETVCTDLQKAKSLGAVQLTDGLIRQYCKN
ncbi:MAG: tetratricopeptide repeat protein [Bacteroidota bacterium]|nr:tetratricopeptide repeat protein [Bacteroidota bacterium]